MYIFNSFSDISLNAVTKKFSWSSLNIGAVYRVSLCQKINLDNFAVCKGRCEIRGTVPPNTIVSVGKTTNLSERMQAHFTPSKTNSNRLLTRFKNIFKEADGISWLSKESKHFGIYNAVLYIFTTILNLIVTSPNLLFFVNLHQMK